MLIMYWALQPVTLPPDLWLLIMLFVGGLVVIIVLGFILVIIYYAYRRSIRGKAEREGVYIDEYVPSKRLWNTCSNIWAIFLCVIILIILFAPWLFYSIFTIPIIFTVETMLLIVWGLAILWAIGIPVFLVIITIVDCLWLRREYQRAISSKSLGQKPIDYQEAERESYSEE